MGTFVKVQHKGQVTIPTRLRKQAGISEGDLIEASFHRGKIMLAPKMVIDRSLFRTADDEYTSEQRRIIDARLAESAEDVRMGQTYGPFESHEEMIEFLHKHKQQRARLSVGVSKEHLDELM